MLDLDFMLGNLYHKYPYKSQIWYASILAQLYEMLNSQYQNINCLEIVNSLMIIIH